MKTNKNGVKLSAFAMALVMVFAAVAVCVGPSETDAASTSTTYLGGEITGDNNQVYGPGSNVVVEKDLLIPQGKTLEIGGKFTVNEGAELTIKGKLIIDETAYAVFNANVTIDKTGVLQNNATFFEDKTNPTGFYLNATLSIERGGMLTGFAIETPAEEPGTDEPGTDPEPEEPGVNALEEEGDLVEGDDGNNDDATTGTVMVNSNGKIVSSSTKQSKAAIVSQIIVLKQGATIDTNAVLYDVTISAYNPGENNTAGSVTVGTSDEIASTGDIANAEIIKVSFSVTSEKVPLAFIKNETGEIVQYKKAVNYILCVEGTVAPGYTMTTQTNDSGLLYAGSDDKKTDVSMPGIVRIASGSTLTVGENGTVNVADNTYLDVAGSLKISGTKDVNATSSIDGRIMVSGNISVNEYVTLTTTSAIVIVSGEGKIEVAAEVSDDFTPAYMLGASYTDEDKEVLVIMTLANAIAGAATADATLVDVSSIPAVAGTTFRQDVVITGELAVPDNIELSIKGIILVSEGSKLTFEDGSEYGNADGAGMLIVVKGDLYDYTMTTIEYANALPANGMNIDAEVRFVDADETYYRYTTLSSALSTATTGDAIELFGGVEVKNTLTIGEGVTVLANNQTITIDTGAELIVNGVLNLITNIDNENAEGSIIMIGDEFKSDGKLTVNNIVVIDAGRSVITSKDANDTTATKYVPGFYAKGTIGDLEDTDMILAPAVAAKNSSTISDVAVLDETAYNGTLSFAAGEESVNISVEAKLTVTNIEIKDYSITVKSNGLLNATVSGANGSVKAVDIKGTAGTEVVITDSVEETDDGTTDIITISGTPAKVEDNKNKVTCTMTVATGTVSVSGTFDASNLKTFNVSEGATLQVAGNNNVFSGKDLTVDGTVNIGAAGQMSLAGALTILGTVDVKSATADSNTYGTLTAPIVYLGMKSDAFKAPEYTVPTTTGTATLNATSVNGMKIVYVLNGASIVEDLVDELDYTEFYVDDVLWMTAYVTTLNTTGTPINDVKNAPITDAMFDGWNNKDGDKIVGTDAKIGSNYERVDAKILYDIYTVQIVGDNGVGTVSIDGVVMIKASNVFVLTDKLSAGTHTVIVELKNGYSGAVEMTMDGKTLTDGKFTLSGTDKDDLSKTIILSGTAPVENPNTPSGSDGSDGMGLTDILLIVLVVLAAILVVIVALRMMRS